jgi:hypothetical protein
MHRRVRPVTAVAVLTLVTGAGIWWWWEHRSGSPVPPARPVAGSPSPVVEGPPAGSVGAPGVAVVVAPGGRPAASPPTAAFLPAQARAYAWLGSRADGGSPPALDADAAAEVAALVDLFERQELHPGSGLPLVRPDGVFRVSGRPAGVPAPVRPPGAADENELADLVRRLAAGEIPAPDGVDPRRHCLLAARVGHVDPPVDGRQRIHGAGVWVALHRQAGSDPVMLQCDPGEEYALSFHGDDFSTVRLDGGLVIPGRCYRFSGTATISGGPVGVHLRPLAAVPAWHDRPLLPPAADN